MSGSALVLAVRIAVVVVAAVVVGLAEPAGIAAALRSTVADRAGVSATIAYVGGRDLFVVGADGSGRRRIAGTSSSLHTGSVNAEPSFSRDGSVVVFVSNRDHRGARDGATEVYVEHADGSSPRRLTVGDRLLSEPRFSPDGQRIAFVRAIRTATDTRVGSSALWVMNADGSGPRQLATGGQITAPAWSPDGRSILFGRQVTGLGTSLKTFLPVVELWVVGSDGSGLRRLTGHADDGQALWSPDGTRIAFGRVGLALGRGGGGLGTGLDGFLTLGVYVIGADGSGLRRLADRSTSPVFSPDGTRIAFVSLRDRNGQSCGEDECIYNGEIYVMNSNGTGQRRLTHNPADDTAPAWSPDGTTIAFASNRANYQGSDRTNEADLYVMPAAGGCPLRLTDSSAAILQPVWSPRGSVPPAVSTAVCRNQAHYAPGRAAPELHTDETAANRRYPFPIYYLGDAFEGLFLTAVQFSHDRSPPGEFPAVQHSLFFDYGRCARNPGVCGPEVQLTIQPVCEDVELHALYRDFVPDVVEIRRGALVTIAHPSDGNSATIYTGTASIQISGSDVQIARAIRELRPFGKHAGTGSLPPPRLPATLLRWIGTIQRAHDHTPDLRRLSRQLRADPARIRTALAIQRALAGHRGGAAPC